MDALSRNSAWNAAEAETFLKDFLGPLRIATGTASGFPMLCSLWYQYHDGRILCATQKDAVLTRHLEADGRCAFELSNNEPPYFGLRGRGQATVQAENAVELLEQVSSRYLGDEESPFKKWLMSRAEDEVCIVIEPTWITTWDYRKRMSG